ncbi:tyrosine-type recombinase/integrase [Glutamicibacter sp. BSL13]
MASLDKYQTPAGAERYRVRWVSNGDRESQSFDTEKDALRWKHVIEAAGGDTGKAVDAIENQIETGPTVTELLTRHIDNLINVGPYQLKRYRSAVPLHFGGDLGELKVRRVNSEHIVAWTRQMQAKGLSVKSIANQRGLLSAAFDTGIRLGYMKDNPVAGVRLPKETRPEEPMRILTMPQFDQLIEAMHEHYRPVTRMMLYTGLRFGEVTALQREDFQLVGATSTVRVRRAWKEDGNHRFYLGPPKTPKARRTVSLPAQADAMLRPILANRAPDEMVFKTVYGRQIRSSAYHKVWGTAWGAMGVAPAARPRPHDLRHTHASMMLAAGMDMYELSRRMGHESVKTTVDRYSHLLEDAHARGASIADSAFG